MIEKFQDFCINNSLSQVIDCATHKDGNTLDLLLTNDVHHIHSHAVIPTLRSISHHHLIHVSALLHIGTKNLIHPKPSLESFAKHNIFHSDVDWDAINTDLSHINWDVEFNGKNSTQMLENVVTLLEEEGGSTNLYLESNLHSKLISCMKS